MSLEADLNLVKKHFPGEVELLPESAVQTLAAGNEVRDIKVFGASQIDLGVTISLLKLVFDCIKFARELRAGSQGNACQERLTKAIQTNYPKVAEVLGEEIEGFVADLCSH